MNRTKKSLGLLLTVLLLVGLLCGCGAASKAANGAYYDTAPGASEEWSEAPNLGYSTGSDLDYGADDGAGTYPETLSSGFSFAENVKIIRRAEIELESTEFDAAAAGLEAAAAEASGYFERSELNNYSRYRQGYYTVRVPAERFQSFCDAVSALCQVNSISRSAEDVSEVYYDTEARLTTQQTKLERLQELLAQAESMEDIIKLESEISETELAIESLTGSLRKYDSLVGFATVNVTLSEVYKLSEIEEPAIGFGAKLGEAFRRGCTGFVDGVQSLLLAIARGWVGWLIFLVIAAVAAILVTRSVRRSRARRAARTPRPAPPQQTQQTQEKSE